MGVSVLEIGGGAMEQALDRDPRLAATTDYELLSDIGKGDERSFDILYYRYARPVAWTARSLLGTNGQDGESSACTRLLRPAGGSRLPLTEFLDGRVVAGAFEPVMTCIWAPPTTPMTPGIWERA